MTSAMMDNIRKNIGMLADTDISTLCSINESLVKKQKEQVLKQLVQLVECSPVFNIHEMIQSNPVTKQKLLEEIGKESRCFICMEVMPRIPNEHETLPNWCEHVNQMHLKCMLQTAVTYSSEQRVNIDPETMVARFDLGDKEIYVEVSTADLNRNQSTYKISLFVLRCPLCRMFNYHPMVLENGRKPETHYVSHRFITKEEFDSKIRHPATRRMFSHNVSIDFEPFGRSIVDISSSSSDDFVPDSSSDEDANNNSV